jgi:hypothetical protein
MACGRWGARATSTVVVAAVIWALGAVAYATTAFPQPRLAPVQPPAQPGELEIAAFYVEGSPDDGSVVVTLQMREPLTAVGDGYRLSVVVGEPAGERERASVVVDDDEVGGVLEAFNGAVWEEVGPTVVDLVPEEGRASLVVPVASVPPEAGIRAEARLDADADEADAVSPWFGATALLHLPDQPRLEGGWWATVDDGTGVAGQTVRLSAPSPWVSLANRALVVGSTERPPSELLGLPVVGDVIFVRLASGFEEATGAADFFLLDRFTGNVQLFRNDPDGLEEVSGDGEWIGVGLPAGDPSAPAASSFDLELIGDALGRRFDPASTVVSVDEAFTLDDGRIATAYGVAATLEWFDETIDATATTTTPAPPPGDIVVEVPTAQVADQQTVPFLVGAGVALLLLVIIAVAAVRRRRRRRARAATPAELPPSHVGVERSGGDEPPARPTHPSQPTRRRPPSPERTEVRIGERAPSSGPGSPTVGAEALAALDEEFQELEERLERLSRRADDDRRR